MTTTSPPLHVFIFACYEYRELVPQCIASIKRFVQDPIASINVVAPCQIDIPGTNLILDQDFWKKLDPDMKYKTLYNAHWFRQQIFKQTLDYYVVDGQALICDAEVVFVRPTNFFVNNKVNYYTTNPIPEGNSQFAFQDFLLGFSKQEKNSFVTDVQVFDTKVLREIRDYIEHRHKSKWLEIHDRCLVDSANDKHVSPDYSMGEFDLVCNYMVKMHPDRINKIKGPFRYVYLNNDRLSMTADELMELAKQETVNDFISVNIDDRSWSGKGTQWLTFYTQVRDPSWPDCNNEEDFVNLPKHIQDECINVFGYAPPKKVQ